MTDQIIEVSPCPSKVFSSFAEVECIGKTIKNEKGRECGEVVGYRIENHELILKIRLYK